MYSDSIFWKVAQYDQTGDQGDDALFKKRETEMQERFKRRDGSTMSLAQSKRASELQRDINAWEENRLVTSGIARYKEVIISEFIICEQFVIHTDAHCYDC